MANEIMIIIMITIMIICIQIQHTNIACVVHGAGGGEGYAGGAAGREAEAGY